MGNITTLVGKKDVQHGVRCLGSVARYCAGSPHLLVFDDGTLTEDDIALLQTALSDCEVITRAERERTIREKLAGFPRCSRFRAENPLAQKLFDIMLWPENDEPLFYCDSDVLFFRPFEDPRHLLSPATDAIFMTDDGFAYSLYPWQLVGAGGVSVAKLINSGIIVAKRSVLDLSFLERVLGDRGIWDKFRKTPCWAEQSCWAILAAKVGSGMFDSAQIRLIRTNDRESIDDGLVALHCISSLRHKLYDLPDGSPVSEGRVNLRMVDCSRLGLTEACLTLVARGVRRLQSANRA